MNAQAQVDLAKLNLSYTRVTAPIDGRMGRRLVDPGNLVGAGGEKTPLADINQIDSIYAYFTVNERDLLRVRKLQQESGAGDYRSRPIPAYAGLANDQGYPHEGRIDFAAITVDPTTGTLLLRAIFPNEDRQILPGLFARIRVPVGREASAILVPEVALGFDQLGRYVLVVNDKNVVERRGVTTGPEENGMVVIDGGLNANERVIVNGLQRAIPGQGGKPRDAGSYDTRGGESSHSRRVTARERAAHVQVFHRAPDLRQRHRHHHNHSGRGVHHQPAYRAVPGDHTADHSGLDKLSGRQRGGGGERPSASRSSRRSTVSRARCICPRPVAATAVIR